MNSIEWKEKGCEICRKLWESGQRPPELAVNYDLHARLHRCSACGVYWEQLERYADVISEKKARLTFPQAFEDEMPDTFTPENELEILLARAVNKEIPFTQFIERILELEFFIPSATQITNEGSGLSPLLFDKNGTQMFSVFTALSKVSMYQDKMPFCLSMKVGELLKRIPKGSGLVVNPGFSVGFDLPPEGVQRIIEELVKQGGRMNDS